MLHGCLDQEYEAETDAPVQAVQDTLFGHIRVHSRGSSMPPFRFAFAYGDGLRTVSHVLAPRTRDGTGTQGVELNTGRAPAMRRVGHAEFVALRRHGGPELMEPGQENTFVLVHEVAGAAGPRVTSADLIPLESHDPEAVAVRVVLAGGREDVYLSTLGGGTIRLQDGTRFEGRLAVIRRQNGRTVAARIFAGRHLAIGDGAASVQAQPPMAGRVMATQRLDNGDPGDGVVVEGLPEGVGDLAGRTLFVEMDQNRDYVWAYRIENVQREGDRTVLWIEHDPGFEIREGGALTKMTYHPGWGCRDPAYWRIASTGLWEAR